MKTEKPANGVKGVLLYSSVPATPFSRASYDYFFRVYDEHDKKIFTDYDLSAEDIEITIDSKVLSLIEQDGSNKLDWSSEYLGSGEVGQ